MERGNSRFTFGGPEFRKSLKVFAWSIGSALVVLLIDFLGAVDMPTQYAFVVPIANTALYAVKEWIADNQN